MSKSLLSINDLSVKSIEDIFALAEQGKKHPEQLEGSLRGKMFGLIFEKPSTRTWVSFDAGLFSMGAGTIYLGPQDIKLGAREEIKDVARVLERYLAGVVLRTFSHKTIVEFRQYFSKPIINGLSDWEHPCQALGDYFTMLSKFRSTKRKPVLTFIGDGNNVLNSLILLAAKLGMPLNYATPKKHSPPASICRDAKQVAKRTGARIEAFEDPKDAVRDADFVYTDVWVSMGQEKDSAKKSKAFETYQINPKLLARCRRQPFVMHCLPAHRGEEITDGVIESKKSIVFEQAENRLHIQKAILLHLCS
ncbi:MAG: ornithine carbamoyltransferase [Candidatus Omnitrophota bacterium]|nr:ornithine carbamoyltransferase [Candidatus Omnitrophota bacterium]